MPSSMPWVKMYTEMLDDPKVGRLPDAVKWRFVQLILLAGELDDEGLLPASIEDVAWRLRVDSTVLINDLEFLRKAGLVHIDELTGGWCVTKFAERQGRPQSEKREQWRDRQQRYRDSHAGVTQVSPVTNPSRGEERREEEIREEEEEEPEKPPPPSFSSFETAQAINSFGSNHHAQEAERVYQQITGQICIPPDKREATLETLANILDGFDGDVSRAVVDGKPVFANWCNTQRADRRGNYSPTNTAWLTKWLERLAPRPDVDTVDSLAQRLARDLGVNR